MKMGTGAIWGIILVIIGLGLIIKVVFNVDLPIFKILFALFFIYLGIKILFGSFNINFKVSSDANDVIFSEARFTDISNKDDYNVMFGKAEFDLRDYELKPGRNKLKVNTIFAGTEIFLNSDMPVKVKSESVFGGSQLPDGSSTGFGTSYYTSDNFDENNDHLVIYTDVVFGGVEIRQQN